jgi:hypothetical protein
MNSNVKIIVFAFFTLACGMILFSQCKKDSNENNENPPVEWVTGAKTTMVIYASPGEEVTETVNGLTFIFPEGGSGTLEVAPIISGVEPVLPGNGYFINYSGSESIQLVLPKNDSLINMVWGWGTAQAYENYYDTWAPIPFDSLNPEKEAFALLMPDSEKGSKDGSSGYNYHWITYLDENSEEGTRYNAMTTDLHGLINRYIDSLPPVLKDSVIARKHRGMHWQMAWSATDTYYKPSYDNKTACLIVQPLSVTNIPNVKSNLAHESGHYLHHLMVYHDTYATLQSQLPWITVQHGLSTVTNRLTYFIEEPAYFADYFQNECLGGSPSQSPEDPKIIWDNNNKPQVKDFPGLEGFGVIMLSSLHRIGNSVRDVWQSSGTTDIPVIGAPFKDIFDMIGKGANSIDFLREQINTYLVLHFKGDLMIPLMQRIGWGYSVKIRVVDAAGNPISGVTARSCYKQGNIKFWYSHKNTTPTSNDGILTLEGVFPGECEIRFYHESDSLDQHLEITWGNKTNEVLDVGDWTVDFSLALPPYLANKNYGIYVGTANFQCDGLGTGLINIPSGIANGLSEDDYIVCHSNGAGTITIDWTKTDVYGNVETCTGSGTVLPHHIVPGIFDTYYYTMNISFTYTHTSYDGWTTKQYLATVTGIDKLDKYMTSNAVCTGTITINWIDANEEFQTCSNTLTFGNFFIHEFVSK